MKECSILLVEDNDELRKLIVRYLEDKPCRISQTSKVDDALEMINSDDGFDLAIVDFWLQVDNASSIIDRLSTSCEKCKILVISGGGMGRSVETTHALADVANGVRFLQKPFSKAELVEEVKAACA